VWQHFPPRRSPGTVFKKDEIWNQAMSNKSTGDIVFAAIVLQFMESITILAWYHENYKLEQFFPIWEFCFLYNYNKYPATISGQI
jgi:hypothetical protein